jgi:hypothetical protein
VGFEDGPDVGGHFDRLEGPEIAHHDGVKHLGGEHAVLPTESVAKRRAPTTDAYRGGVDLHHVAVAERRVVRDFGLHGRKADAPVHDHPGVVTIRGIEEMFHRLVRVRQKSGEKHHPRDIYVFEFHSATKGDQGAHLVPSSGGRNNSRRREPRSVARLRACSPFERGRICARIDRCASR